MPDVDAADDRRGAWLHPMMFWGGIGLAPLAALLILLGEGGMPVRMGAVMGVLAPVMIGISFAVRPNPESIRLQFEETLLEELDLLRGEVREEIANSARASHQMVGERLGAIQQTIDTLRAGAGTRAVPGPPGNGQPALPTPYQATGAASVPPPTRPVTASRASVPRAAVVPPPAGTRAMPPTRPVPPPGAPRSVPTGAPRSAAPPGVPRSAPPPPSVGRPAPPAPAAPAPYAAGNGRAGVVPPDRRAGAGGRSGRHQADGPPTSAGFSGYNGGDSGYGGAEEWTAPAPRRRSAEGYEESWTDQRLRERYGRVGPAGDPPAVRPRPYDRGDDPSSGEPWRQREDGQWAPVSAEPAGRGRRRRWEDESSADVLRDGDRSNGDRSGRHNGTGSIPRYDDRWPAGRDEPNGYGAGSNGYGGGRPDYTRRALPAGRDHRSPEAGGEPSWNDSWEEPARESRAHRYRPDFELTDERWR